VTPKFRPPNAEFPYVRNVTFQICSGSRTTNQFSWLMAQNACYDVKKLLFLFGREMNKIVGVAAQKPLNLGPVMQNSLYVRNVTFQICSGSRTVNQFSWLMAQNACSDVRK
jgi:hypothetical protein